MTTRPNPSLVSVAASAAFALGFAGSVAAANVEIYGLVETGLNYSHVDADDGNGSASKFEQRAGQFIPSRWGLRGTEELDNGMRVGFNLEGQFALDTGEMTGGRLFQRTAQLWVGGPYGELLLGRSGLLRSGFGTTGIWGAKVNPFSSSVGQYISGSKYIFPGDFKAADNTITYRTPDMNGLRLHAQFSGKMDQAKYPNVEEFEGGADRNWGIGATYTKGALHLAAVLDSIMYGKDAGYKYAEDFDDSLGLSLAAVYDFGLLKLYTSAMWFDGMLGSKFQGHQFGTTNSVDQTATYKGYGLQIGSDVPAFGGTFKVNLGWMDAKVDEKALETSAAEETDRISVSTGYVYPLSKRTNAYVAAGYMRDSFNDGWNADTTPQAYEVMIGMWHRF